MKRLCPSAICGSLRPIGRSWVASPPPHAQPLPNGNPRRASSHIAGGAGGLPSSWRAGRWGGGPPPTSAGARAPPPPPPARGAGWAGIAGVPPLRGVLRARRMVAARPLGEAAATRVEVEVEGERAGAGAGSESDEELVPVLPRRTPAERAAYLRGVDELLRWVHAVPPCIQD
jgi:hypothetical protein